MHASTLWRCSLGEKCSGDAHLYSGLMNVELRHLRALLALERELSFTDASISLGISQAAVSRTIAQLEAAVGVTLVERTTRRVALTEAGSKLADAARIAVGAVESGIGAARGPVGHLRLGYSWAALGRHTAAVRRDWSALHPSRPLRIVRVHDADAGLVAGSSDVAVLRSGRALPSVESVAVGTEARVCAVAADDDWVAPVTLAMIAGRSIGVNRRTGSTSEALWDSIAPAPAMLDTHDVDDWLDLIASGTAVGVTTEATAHHYPRPDVRYLSIVDAPPVGVSVAWRAGAKPREADELVELVSSQFARGA